MAASTAALATSARAMATECDLLLRTLERTGSAGSATLDRLEEASRAGLAGPTTTRRGFDAASDAPEEVGSDEDVLAAVMTELALGHALLAAGRAIGEDGSAPRPTELSGLAGAVGELTGVAALLDEHAAPAAALRLGFDAASPDDATALASLRRDLDALLAELTDGCVDVVTQTVPEVLDRVPVLGDVVDAIGAHIDLGTHVARFARLGLAAVDRALRALAGLLPAGALTAVRREVATLLERLSSGEVATAVVGWAIGADSVRTELAELGTPTTDDRAVLDHAAAVLRDLATRFERVTVTARRIVKLILACAATLAVFVAVPHVALAVAAALLLVVAAVLAVAADYTDARPLPGVVVGARTILRTAWGRA